MATLRALRLLQSIESKNINSAQLETLLAGNASRQTDLPLLFGRRVATERILAPETLPTILGSPSAAGGLGASTLAMNTIAASVSAMGMVVANTQANAAIAAKTPAGIAVTANKSVYLATIGQSGVAIQSAWAKHWGFPKKANAAAGGLAATAIRQSDGLMISSNGGSTYKSSDGAETWAAGSGNIPSNPRISCPPNAGGIFVAVQGSGGNLVATSTDGSFSSAAALPSNQQWSKVVARSASSYLVIALNASSNVAATSASLAASWAPQTLPVSASWTDLAASTASYVVIGGYTGSCITSATGATGSWSTIPLPFNQSWSSVDAGTGLDDGKFMAVGGTANGAFSSNHGATWSAVSLPAGHNWARVVYHAASRAWIAFSSNTAFVATSVDDGATWSLKATPAVLGTAAANNCGAGGPYVFVQLPTPAIYVNV